MKKKFLKNKSLRKIKIKERQNKSVKSFQEKLFDDLNLNINIDNIDLKDIKIQEFDGELVLKKIDKILEDLGNNFKPINTRDKDELEKWFNM